MKKLLLILLFFVFNVAYAETKVIIPFGAGGGTEITYRHFEKYLLQEKDIKLITWYKPGAYGVVGLQELSRAPKDGSVVCYTTIASLSEALKVSNLKFEYVTALNKLPMVLVTNKKTNIKNYKEFTKKIKGDNLYSFGYVSAAQLIAVNQIIDTVKPKNQVVLAPYKSVSQALTDLIGGQIDFVYVPYQSAKEFVEENKLTILGSAIHLKDYPNIFQFNKSYKNWVDVSGYAFVLPKDTPREHVDFWRKTIYDYMNDPNTKQQMSEDDSIPYTFGESFLKQMVFEINK